MDFTPTPGQVDTEQLARQVFADRCTNARQQAVEADGDRFDRELWTEFGSLGLLGLPLPEEHGGAGLGLLEVTTLLTEAGRVVAPLPLAAHLAAAVVVAEHGDETQRATWLPDAASGEALLTPALAEDLDAAPEHPATTAVRDTTGWSLEGAKTTVAAGPVAGLFLVPATTDEGVRVFLVHPDDAGVAVLPQQLSDGDLAARLELAGVRLGEDRVLARGAARRLSQLATLADCAWQLGVCEGALQLTATYAKTREQFSRPIGSFQAVSQRLADAYIDVHGLRLTTTHAAWRLSEGLPADVELATAKLWAADTGHRLAHTTVHVHGGVGIDLDGEAHRYFTAAKRAELSSGGATVQARAVGRALAVEPA